MMFDRIDHIAIAVDDLDQAIETYASVLGLQASEREFVAAYDVEIATLRVGDMAIELIEGKTAESPIRKFIERRGPGLHHVGFVVTDIEKALSHLRAEGVALIDEKPRRGKGNSLVAFVHPQATGRVLYELVQLAEE